MLVATSANSGSQRDLTPGGFQTKLTV